MATISKWIRWLGKSCRNCKWNKEFAATKECFSCVKLSNWEAGANEKERDKSQV